MPKKIDEVFPPKTAEPVETTPPRTSPPHTNLTAKPNDPMGRPRGWDEAEGSYVGDPIYAGPNKADAYDGFDTYNRAPSYNQSTAYTGGGGGGGGGKSYYFKRCTHTGSQPLFLIGDKSFAGASQYDMTSKYDVNLKCNGLSTAHQAMIRCSPKYAELEKFQIKREYVSLDWPDMGSPPISYDFWPAFIESLPEHCDVVVNCTGGHGRTGTALACIYLVASRCTAWEAIDFIRDNYCKHAIETLDQEVYIEQTALHFGLKIGFYEQEDEAVAVAMTGGKQADLPLAEAPIVPTKLYRSSKKKAKVRAKVRRNQTRRSPATHK